MASFTSGRTDFTPHGKNQILRHAHPGSYTVVPKTVASGTFPAETIDGFSQKILQEGEAMAVCTSGADIGKVVPFQIGGPTDGRELVANLVGISKDYFGAELNDRDVEAGILDHGHLVQAWCTERNAAGVRVPLSNTTADALRGKKNLQIQFS